MVGDGRSMVNDHTQSFVSVKQFVSPDRMAHTCTAHKLLSAKSELCGSIQNPETSKIKTEINCSSSLPAIPPFDLQKCSPVSNTENSISRTSQDNFSVPILSSSSTFCTSMYSISSENSNTCQQTSTLPFLPHPPKCGQQQQQASAEQSSSSSSLLYGADLNGGGHDDTEHSDDLRDFLNLSGDALEGSFHGESNAMAFKDQMEFQFLSEQLGIAMTDNEDNPRLDVSPLLS